MFAKINSFSNLLFRKFPLVTKVTLISVYLIFLAGAVVRMTGSGMGCPDWPKCFGYLIPPTSEAEITWQPSTAYKEGMIIVKNEKLFVAKKDLSTGVSFVLENWSNYTKHNYAKFNKYHTWTEYINRLSSVVSGFIFIFFVLGALRFWKHKKEVTILSLLAFFLMGFEAWLGKTVVDSNLKPIVITIHMVVGLIIVALLLYVLFIVDKNKTGSGTGVSKLFGRLVAVSVILSMIQIAMGTQVRQFIDEQVKLYGFDNKQYSLMAPSFKFYFHRSFTIAIVLVNFGVFYVNQIKNLNFKLVNWILILIFLETLTGILMYYANFPIGTQAIHLLSGAVLFGLQFYLLMQNRGAKMIKNN